MTDALHAEWTKLRSLPSTGWLLIAAVTVTIAVSAVVAGTTHVSLNSGGQDPTKLALIGIDLGQAVIAVLAVLTIAEEYGTGMITATLAAIPRRLALLTAKAVNLTGLTLIAGTLAVTGCLTAGRLLLPAGGLTRAHGYDLISISHGATLRAALGSVIYLILIALLALGVATAVRDTAASIGVVLGLLYLLPILAQTVTDPWRRHLDQIAPMSAGLAIQATTNVASLPISPWAGLGILTAWTTAALIAGALRLHPAGARTGSVRGTV